MLILCGMPGDGLPRNPWLERIFIDKWVHFILHASFVFFILRGSKLQLGSLSSRHYLKAITISFFYGVFIELMQTWVFVHRSGDALDVITNLVGAVFTALIFEKLPKFLNS